MSRLYVVVAKVLGVVLQVVDNLCGNIRRVSLNIVGIVARGLSLQDVAVVQQDDVVAVALALTLEVGADSCHRTRHRTAFSKVVWEEGTMDVRCFYQSQGDGLGWLGHHGHAEACECEDCHCLSHKYKYVRSNDNSFAKVWIFF